jgi:hypothetical protein
MQEVNVGDVKIITLERWGDSYQKQLCIIPPWTKIPLHRHENVRTQITFLHGWSLFYKNGVERELTFPQDCGRSFIIDPSEEHGCFTQVQPLIFITEQYWLNNEPVKSLHLNWQGAPINEQHAEQLRGI